MRRIRGREVACWFAAVIHLLGDSGQVVHTHTHTRASVTELYNLVLAKGGDAMRLRC